MAHEIMSGSCDTFVVLPPLTKHGIVFGKNSDRPRREFAEVVYRPGGESPSSVKCTYIKIEVSGPKKAVILCKPNWMWGAEMGANECGVVIGNEAIFTKDNDGDHNPSVRRLLGMDLLRLGLEYSSSASEAVEVITRYLEKYGQGGECDRDDSTLVYHNSYLIADLQCAWILETTGKHWAAEKVTSGYRNISNVLTITTKMDKKSKGLFEYAKKKGFWNGTSEFNFAEVFNDEKKPGASRFAAGKHLLEDLTISKNFKETDMFTILRHKESNICRPYTAEHPTKSSQVSVLRTDKPSVHWFTATQDPSKSVFKPFVFTKNPVISVHTQILNGNIDEPPTLYALHEKTVIRNENYAEQKLRNMENEFVTELNTVIDSTGTDLSKLNELFKHYVETEVKFYGLQIST